MTLAEIRQRKAAKVAEQRAMLAKAQTENRNLNADESAKFDALKVEITELEQAEHRQQFVDEQERRAAGVTVVNGNGTADNFATLESRVLLLDVLRAGMEGRALSGAAAEYAQEAERRGHKRIHSGGLLVPLRALDPRAVEARATTTTTAAGLVPTDHLGSEYIGPLRDALLVRSLGVRTLANLDGNVSIPKHGAGLTVGWVAEGGDLPESNLGAASVTLTPHHVGGITELSRQLIQQSSPDVERLAREDLSFAVAAAVDAAIISGSGVGAIPKGLTARTGVNGAVQTADMPATWQDVLAIEQQLAGVNVKPSGWYTSPGVMTTLRGTLKEAGLPGYIATADKIGDLSAASSNHAGAGIAILGDWSQVMVGQWGSVELLLNPFAESAYRRGGVLLRAFMTVDVQCRHEQAFVIAS